MSLSFTCTALPVSLSQSWRKSKSRLLSLPPPFPPPQKKIYFFFQYQCNLLPEGFAMVLPHPEGEGKSSSSFSSISTVSESDGDVDAGPGPGLEPGRADQSRRRHQPGVEPDVPRGGLGGAGPFRERPQIGRRRRFKVRERSCVEQE